jgi:hypothetical protein
MEPGSQAETSPEPSPNRLADVLGTLIALLTLIVPSVAIAYFSSEAPEVWQTPNHHLIHLDRE